MSLASAQQKLGWQPTIWSLDSEETTLPLTERYSNISRQDIRGFPCTGPGFIGFSPAMEKAAVGDGGGEFDIVVQQDLWHALSRATGKWRKVHNRPTLVVPHGGLEKWAIRKSHWKKRIALRLYDWHNLVHASCIHAVAEPEIADCRNLGLKNPVAVIPTCIDAEWPGMPADAEAFREAYGISREKRILLFVSRVTPKKNLPALLQCMADLRPHMRDWVLVIAGVDEFDHERHLRSLVQDLGLQSMVRFIGPVYGSVKRDAYESADLFVLPSVSEGAPMVIVEALGAGVPVIATQASPWKELEAHNCGWWCDISIQAIRESLLDALGKSPQQLKELGERGRALVCAKYLWPVSAQRTIELYEWLLGRRDMPDFVDVG
jgi:glycosyltransferase involved in cell wall biosynthesis